METHQSSSQNWPFCPDPGVKPLKASQSISPIEFVLTFKVHFKTSGVF
jgi:hypothetical protein